MKLIYALLGLTLLLLIWSAINPYEYFTWFLEVLPAIITRELLIRKSEVNTTGWLNFIVVCIAMAISVICELIEWGVSISTGDCGDAFLGTQGYIWDTQSDMLYASIGAIIALTIFGRYHSSKIIKMNMNVQNELF